MPKGVFAALLAAADHDRCNIHLVHAEEDTLRDWHPSLYVMSHRLTCTLVTESAKWMSASNGTGCTVLSRQANAISRTLSLATPTLFPYETGLLPP